MEMLFLLKNLYRDPLALSRFSQFRCLHISKGELIQDLNETHEFQVLDNLSFTYMKTPDLAESG